MLQTTTSLHSNNINIYTGEITKVDKNLGTSGKSVGTHEAGAKGRARRYVLQDMARKLLPGEQVAQCMHRCGRGGVAVNVSQASGIASYAGVVTCKSVWHCPVCSAKISNGRRKELNTALSWCRSMGYQPVLMTLTARHGAGDSLFGLLLAMKSAKQKLHQSREWSRLKRDLVGHITATEVTHGRNGWHVHFHCILLVVAESPEHALSKCDLHVAWLRALDHKDIKLGGNGYAFDVQDASAAGDYISKWGAAEEVALGDKKRGNRESRTPWELLGDAADDARSAELFQEYAANFKGKRQLVWSPGLKRVLDIVEKSDAEIADEAEADDLVTVAIVPKKVWRLVCRYRLQAELLEVAEYGGRLYVEGWCQALILKHERGLQSAKGF